MNVLRSKKPSARRVEPDTSLAGDLAQDLPGQEAPPQISPPPGLTQRVQGEFPRTRSRPNHGDHLLFPVPIEPGRITTVAVVRVGAKWQARAYVLQDGVLIGWYPIRDPEYLAHAQNHATVELETLVARSKKGRYEAGGVR